MKGTPLGLAILKLLGKDSPVPPKERDYEAMAAALRELDQLLPEGTRPWEVAQIALEFADWLAEDCNHLATEWNYHAEHQKAEKFVYFLKNHYGRHQPDPLEDEDH